MDARFVAGPADELNARQVVHGTVGGGQGARRSLAVVLLEAKQTSAASRCPPQYQPSLVPLLRAVRFSHSFDNYFQFGTTRRGKKHESIEQVELPGQDGFGQSVVTRWENVKSFRDYDNCVIELSSSVIIV